MAVLLTLAIATPALAGGVLPIRGVYGNAAGCNLFFTGQGGDEVLLLTEHTFTHGQTGCYFEALASEAADGHFAVDVSCSLAGAPSGEARLDVQPAEGTGGLMASFGDGRVFGPLLNCPGTEELFKPEGLQI